MLSIIIESPSLSQKAHRHHVHIRTLKLWSGLAGHYHPLIIHYRRINHLSCGTATWTSADSWHRDLGCSCKCFCILNWVCIFWLTCAKYRLLQLRRKLWVVLVSTYVEQSHLSILNTSLEGFLIWGLGHDVDSLDTEETQKLSRVGVPLSSWYSPLRILLVPISLSNILSSQHCHFQNLPSPRPSTDTYSLLHSHQTHLPPHHSSYHLLHIRLHYRDNLPMHACVLLIG